MVSGMVKILPYRTDPPPVDHTNNHLGEPQLQLSYRILKGVASVPVQNDQFIYFVVMEDRDNVFQDTLLCRGIHVHAEGNVHLS